MSPATETEPFAVEWHIVDSSILARITEVIGVVPDVGLLLRSMADESVPRGGATI